MGEGLGEVPQRLPRVARLLGIQAERAGVAQDALEQEPGLLELLSIRASGAGERLDEPERAHVEGALAAGQPVLRALGIVAIHQAVRHEAALARRLGEDLQHLQHLRIAGGQKEHQRHDQVGRVEVVASVMLDERLAALAPPTPLDLLVDGVTLGQPTLTGRGKGALVREAEPAIERHPAHELGVDEVLLAPAGLPDPLVGAAPVCTHPIEQRAEVGPEVGGDGRPVLVGEVHRIHQLAVDVELELIEGAVADADGPRAAVPVEVVERVFGQVAPAVDPVHDLQGSVPAGFVDARLQPLHEPRRLLGEADPQQRVEGERGVPDPGVAVVPISHASQLLGEAAGGRRDDGARGLEREKLEDQRGAVDDLAPAAAVGALREPSPPELDGGLEQLGRLVARRGQATSDARGGPPEHERRALPLREHKPGGDAVGAGPKGEVRRERERQVRPLEHRTGRRERDPGPRAGVVECGRAEELEFDAASRHAHAPHDLIVPLGGIHDAGRHEVPDLAHSRLREEAGDQNVGVRPVELLEHDLGVGHLRVGRTLHGADREAASFVVVEQGPEHARRVEVGKAEPIDRATPAHQRHRAHVADHAVVLDGFVGWLCHSV
jgi:hypothetical protein